MDTTRALNIQFQVTLSDLIGGWRFYKSRTAVNRIRIVFTIILLAIGLWLYSQGGLSWYVALIAILALDTWFDITGIVRCWISYRANSRLYEDPYYITIDDNGVHAKNSSLDAQRLWAGYWSYFENDKMFLLEHGKGAFAVIPKRAFSDPSEVAMLRDLLRDKIKKAEQHS